VFWGLLIRLICSVVLSWAVGGAAVQQHDYQLAKAAGAVADAPTIGQWLQYLGPAVLALVGLLAPGSKDGAGKLLELIKALFGNGNDAKPAVVKPSIRPTDDEGDDPLIDDDDEGDDDAFLSVRVRSYGEDITYLGSSAEASQNLSTIFTLGSKSYAMTVQEVAVIRSLTPEGAEWQANNKPSPTVESAK
jgi:hypothetical protein